MKINKPTILLISASQVDYFILQKALAKDFDLVFANSSEKGLEVATGKQPSLILLDIIMPRITGYELCGILKKTTETKEIPIIFLSNVTEPGFEEKALNLGAIDYITKPIVPSIISLRIHTHLKTLQAKDSLKSLSYIDALTSIYNRRYFEENLAKEWKRMFRNQKPISLIMIDIDYYKKYNDHYGHLQGDKCLQEVALALKNSLRRSSDFVARYGGEEFALVLPESNIEFAELLATNLIDSIRGLEIKHKGSYVSEVVTISAGVGCMFPSSHEEWTALVQKADKALYKAKENGRNQSQSALDCDDM